MCNTSDILVHVTARGRGRYVMLDELDEMLGSPEQLQRRLDALDAKLARMARGYEELDRATESLRVTETDPSGAVRVTVDSLGRLLEVVTTPQVARLPAEQVGPLVLACVQRAQSRIAGRIAALAGDTVGEDEMATHVVDTMRARFPEPAQATPVRSAGPGHLDIGGIDDYDDDPLGRGRDRRGRRA
jgi:DNA-binding protein YbaB